MEKYTAGFRDKCQILAYQTSREQPCRKSYERTRQIFSHLLPSDLQAVARVDTVHSKLDE
jgi:hypothetical protein